MVLLNPAVLRPGFLRTRLPMDRSSAFCDLVAPVQFRFMFLGYWLVLATATSHAGFENLVLGDKAHL